MKTTSTPSEKSALVSPAHQAALHWINAGPKGLLIDGSWGQAASGRTFDSINPETEQPLIAIAEADEADIDRAVRAARSAFEAPSRAGLTPHGRSRMLLRVADLGEPPGRGTCRC